MAEDGMVSLSGGLPHPSLFPFVNLSVSAYSPSTVLDPLNPDDQVTTLQEITVSRQPDSPDRLGLAGAMQYDTGPGHQAMRDWAVQFTKDVFTPAYDDWEVILNSGNTDGWTKVVRLLCEPGDSILCEEQTYPSAQAVWAPMGCKAVPVSIDGRGMRADSLEELLAGWHASHPGVRRPRLLYNVPVGSNPTGTTMDEKRKKAIYKVCVEYDVVICEDDPYYFLQYPDYDRTSGTYDPVESQPTSPTEYLQSLAPTFLKFDYEGRVIRLETFSKTLAPGNRCGFFVANPIFIERLLRATEVETQAPSGWAVVVLSNLLLSWGTDGYLQWLGQLRNQYRARRDWMCTAIDTTFNVQPVETLSSPPLGAEGLVVSTSGPDSKPIFSFVPSTAGMFLWARFYFYNSARFLAHQAAADCVDPERVFQDEVWLALAKEKVLLTPGSYYTPWQGKNKLTTESRGGEKGIGYFRLSFSMVTKEAMELGIQRLHKVLAELW